MTGSAASGAEIVSAKTRRVALAAWVDMALAVAPENAMTLALQRALERRRADGAEDDAADDQERLNGSQRGLGK